VIATRPRGGAGRHWPIAKSPAARSTSETPTPTATRCPETRNAAKPRPAAPSRIHSGDASSAPVGKTTSLAVTAITSAVATERTQ